MKFIKKIKLTLLFLSMSFFALTHISHAKEKENFHFAIVSMQKISESCDVFQNIKSQMEEKANKMRIKFDKKAKDLRQREVNLEKSAKLLKADALKEEIDNINKEKLKINEELNVDRQKLEKIYFDTMNEFHQKINHYISEYSESNEIDAVFEASNLVYQKNFKNITEDIVKKINKDIKDYNIKFDD